MVLRDARRERAKLIGDAIVGRDRLMKWISSQVSGCEKKEWAHARVSHRTLKGCLIRVVLILALILRDVCPIAPLRVVLIIVLIHV